MFGLRQRVVIIESMGFHERVLYAHVVGKDNGNWWRRVAGLTPAFQDNPNGMGMDGSALKRFFDGGLQLGCAVAVEQLQ